MAKTGLDLSDLDRALEGLFREGTGVMGEVAPVIADMLVTAVADEFASEGRGRWPGLADSTIAKRRKRQPTGKIRILQDTGIMAGSMTPYSNAQLAEAFTNVPYSGFHTSKRPRRIIPLRDFTDVDLAEVQEEAAELLLAYVLRRAS
jgi:phage gpG-like protein